jgi:hypothetical protein
VFASWNADQDWIISHSHALIVDCMFFLL